MTLPDIDALANFGGQLNNYRPVEDPSTDLDAAFGNKVRTNVAAMSQTAVRSIVVFTTATTTAGLVLVGYRAVWGNAAGVAPTLARTSAGIYTITHPATVVDELGASHTVSIFAATGSVEGSTSLTCNAAPSPRYGNVVTVNLFSTGSSPALTDAAGTTLIIEMS